jgi:hypothetical protein
MIALLVFEAQGMLTNSQRHNVRIGYLGGRMDADITDTQGGGSDAWYDILNAVPEEIQRCNDRKRMLEFIQDVLLSMSDHLKNHVTGIRHDQHGLLDFLLDRERDPMEVIPCPPPESVDVIIADVRYKYHPWGQNA